MKVTFSMPCQDGDYAWMNVYVDGKDVGEAYKEDGMEEWAADAGVEAVFGENVATGCATPEAFQRALLREAQ